MKNNNIDEIITKEYNKIEPFVSNLMKECQAINTLDSLDPAIFNEPAIYGVVASKYATSKCDNIQMDLEILTNIKDIDFSIPELSRILGILLDNAIEATKNAETKYVRLEMKYDKRKCADVIRVINTYDTNIQIDLEGIYKKGVSSKKVKSGIGLWEVKNIISKYNNAQIFPSIENDKFVQNVIIEQ